MRSLESLDLSNNQLSGEIPEHLVEGCISLAFLLLSNNSLQGQIFSKNFNLPNLLRLQLDGNHFIGNIPDSLLNSSLLVGLSLSDNHPSGRISSWLGNMSDLSDIIMPNNNFEGPIPVEFYQLEYLEVLDLSENNITGDFPSCPNSLYIHQVHLSRNKLQGQLKEAFYDSSYNHFDGSIPKWIGRLSQKSYLILSNNNFDGEMPIQLCRLYQLRLIDLSCNNLSSHIPPCLDTALHDKDYDVALGPMSMAPGPIAGVGPAGPSMRKGETIEFTTKSISYSYKGRILNYLFGIDLSCNKLIGEIPYQVGNLTRIHSLNLTHNLLAGPILPSFSYLRQIESLDLSYNYLNGKIPTLPLSLLSYTIWLFSVWPIITGNLLLCGLQLPKSSDTTESPSTIPGASTEDGEDSNIMDMDIFYIRFTRSYVTVLLVIGSSLCINPYWRRTWFYLIEMWMTSCYYFIVDCLPKQFCNRNI